MKTSSQITLNDHWFCEYFEHDPDVFEFAGAGVSVPALDEWTCGERYLQGWAAYLQRTFYLTPTDECVSYILQIDSAPGVVVLFINGRRMGEFDGSIPFSFDVTDYVALEDNGIALRVDCGAEGHFGKATLEQVPCS